VQAAPWIDQLLSKAIACAAASGHNGGHRVTRKTVAVCAVGDRRLCGDLRHGCASEAHQHQPVYAMPITVVIVAGSLRGAHRDRRSSLQLRIRPAGAMARTGCDRRIIMYGFLVAGTLILLPAIVLIVLGIPPDAVQPPT